MTPPDGDDDAAPRSRYAELAESERARLAEARDRIAAKRRRERETETDADRPTSRHEQIEHPKPNRPEGTL